MLQQLADDHAGRSAFRYLDVSYAETVRRHAGRPQAAQFTPEDMRGWYLEHDVLGMPGEQITCTLAGGSANLTSVVAHAHAVPLGALATAGISPIDLTFTG